MDGKELFLMIEAISNEKNITKEDVLESLEEALAVATKKRSNIEVRVEVDRHTGEFKTFRQWQVIEDGEEFVDELNINWAELTLYKAKGCSCCNDSGYKGRAGVHEILPISEQNRHNIYSNQTSDVIAKQGIKDGMRTLVQDGIIKVLIGVTDFKQLQTISNLED